MFFSKNLALSIPRNCALFPGIPCACQQKKTHQHVSGVNRKVFRVARGVETRRGRTIVDRRRRRQSDRRRRHSRQHQRRRQQQRQANCALRHRRAQVSRCAIETIERSEMGDKREKERTRNGFLCFFLSLKEEAKEKKKSEEK